MDVVKEKRHIIECIKKFQVLFIEDFWPLYISAKGTLPRLSKKQFLELGYDKDEDILEAINCNKRKVLNNQLKSWLTSTNAQLQIAAFKLLCTEEELRRLVPGYQQDSIDKNIQIPNINVQIIENKNSTYDLPSIEIKEIEEVKEIEKPNNDTADDKGI